MAKSIIQRYQHIKRRLRPISRKQSCCSSIDFGHGNYSRYICRVLKEVVPMKGLSSDTVDILNFLINDVFERIATEAGQLMYLKKRCTLTLEDIQKAVYLLLPKKLAKFAATFGSRAVQRFVHS
ncbi:Histone H2B variant L1 [Lemmus lemmus]